MNEHTLFKRRFYGVCFIQMILLLVDKTRANSLEVWRDTLKYKGLKVNRTSMVKGEPGARPRQGTFEALRQGASK